MRYLPEHRYYWRTPTEGGSLAKQWEFGRAELDTEGELTRYERFTRGILSGMLKPSAHDARTVLERTAMTAARRHEQARALVAGGVPVRESTVVDIVDSGLTLETIGDASRSATPRAPLADASIVTVRIVDGGRTVDAVTVVPRTVVVDRARPFYVVDHPDDPIPMWAGR
ncbi:hypothetical protein [Gordonia hydrophobica]|uniref:Uncharacterized protein n=1 Tax=Gordonia hydrophobica TaxID=40516 RepID=A0ABZ2U520_9ACTN|nr:hypothetical protein [Gordonia hydrophobica]MBM7368659.1 hypothetical protein [Gordonia hydrophobica]